MQGIIYVINRWKMCSFVIIWFWDSRMICERLNGYFVLGGMVKNVCMNCHVFLWATGSNTTVSLPLRIWPWRSECSVDNNINELAAKCPIITHSPREIPHVGGWYCIIEVYTIRVGGPRLWKKPDSLPCWQCIITYIYKSDKKRTSMSIRSHCLCSITVKFIPQWLVIFSRTLIISTIRKTGSVLHCLDKRISLDHTRIWLMYRHSLSVKAP